MGSFDPHVPSSRKNPQCRHFHVITTLLLRLRDKRRQQRQQQRGQRQQRSADHVLGGREEGRREVEPSSQGVPKGNSEGTLEGTLNWRSSKSSSRGKKREREEREEEEGPIFLPVATAAAEHGRRSELRKISPKKEESALFFCWGDKIITLWYFLWDVPYSISPISTQPRYSYFIQQVLSSNMHAREREM